MNIFTRFFTKFYAKPLTADEIRSDLIRRESEIGRHVFGPIPPGVRREFFCLDHDTWVWHEESRGNVQVTRYKLKKREIIKSVNGGQYERVSIEEARRLAQATQTYKTRVQRELYDKLSFA